MLADLIDKYAWLDNRYDINWTVAIIEGVTPLDAIRIYGGDPDQPVGHYPFAQLYDLQGPGEPEDLRFHMQALIHDGYTITLEANGWSGAMPELARRCTHSG